jgi:serine/threonine protein kinase/tetratricopeptide (TPR) repeat protein
MTIQAAPQHERYEELSTLGRGGAGTVYLVRDRETGDRLALKRLLRAEEESLLRLKREFRALAGISHPNLVRLYELGRDETSAFFTMEYLPGEDLKKYLDRDSSGERLAANDNDKAERVRIARVLGAYEQLASGVRALHAAGLLHRDLKPSNVMVANDRVVVLDFGIALDVGAGAATITQDKLSSGTPAYMAPEQVQGVHIGEPNDWYAFGAMLYEALSGSLPIEGRLAELLTRKSTHDPTPISELVPALPNEIAELCMQLLRREPEQRPNGERVLQVLRAHVHRAPTLTADSLTSLAPNTRSRTEAELSLFGRDDELAALWASFRTVQAGQCGVVHVSGESGSGKSLLLHHFCDEVARSGFVASELQPLVLRSRCYERETLPYKALDAAIDALVSHLSREADVVVSHALPRNLLALTQLFPALKSLPATRQLLAREKLPAGMTQARALAEAGLHDLLSRLGQMRPVVLWIDDLQWGDLDSVGILSRWLTPPHIANLMLVFSYRSEERATSPALRALLHSEGSAIETQIEIKPLGEEHVRALCKQRFELAKLAPPAQVIERIVAEAQGSPFLASQLTALAIAKPTSSQEQLARLTLEELVRSRSGALSLVSRKLLNVLSVAARPIPLALAVRAADVVREARACIHELQSQHLIRTRESAGDRLLEVYHDRLREMVSSLLSAEERLELDQRILAALRQTGSTDNDWLHVLALAVGEDADALRYGIAAAARASDALAFERAADLYERCVKLSPDPSANNGELWHKLALAYAYAGHGSKAANTYLHAAQHVSAEQSLLFERAAASQLLCSGRFEEGEALVQRVLARLGLSTPSSEAGLFAALGWERALLAVRGLNYKPHPRSELSAIALRRGELYGMLSMETAVYDPLRAALFQARCLRLALERGEPEHVARALCAAATMTSVEASEKARLRADDLLRRAEVISHQVPSAVLRTNIASARAICAFLTGRIAESIELCEQAEHLLRTASGDSEYHHRFTIASARIGALLQLARYREAETELQAYLKEAAATENINAQLHITMAEAWADTNADRASAAISRLDGQREQLPQIGFGLLHVLHMIAVMRIGCATGEYDWALDTTRAHWQSFQRSVVRRSDSFSMFAYEAHGRLVLCHAARNKRSAGLRRELADHRAALKKAEHRCAPGELLRIDARIALAQGDKAKAIERLMASIASFERAGATDQAARDRWALGALQGGLEGAALQESALAYLTELGVIAPIKQLHGYYPELIV